MSTILPPPAVSTPAHEWAEGTTDALDHSKDHAKPTDGDYVATQVQQSEPTPNQEFPGGYPQTPGTAIPIGSSVGVGGGYIPEQGIVETAKQYVPEQGIVEAAKQYIPTGEQISSYLPAAVKGYFPGSTDSDSNVGTDTLPKSDAPSLPKSDFGTTTDTWTRPDASATDTSIPPPAAEVSSEAPTPYPSVSTPTQDTTTTSTPVVPRKASPTPRTSETLAALGAGDNTKLGADDPSLGDVSTMATVGTPGSVTTPTPGFNPSFTPTTDVVSNKGVDPSTKASDYKEEVIETSKIAPLSQSSPLSKAFSDESKPSTTQNQEKPLPESPKANLGARDHPLPPLASAQEKHLQGDELLASPESKPSLGTGATISTGGAGSTAADAGHSTLSNDVPRASTDTSGSKFHETSSKMSDKSNATAGSGKVKFTDKIKGEVKILSGKMSKDEAKIEEGKRLMGKV